MKKHIPTVYLVRADINKPFGEGNWYTFTEAEYIRFKQTDEFKKCVRYFGILDEEDEDGYIIVAECPKEKAKEINCDHSRKRYKKQQLKDSGITIISYEEFISDRCDDAETASGDILLKDPSSDTCTAVISKERDETVRRETDKLSPLKKDIIYDLYLSDSPESITACAESLGITRPTLRAHRDDAFRTLSSALSDWRWD